MTSLQSIFVARPCFLNELELLISIGRCTTVSVGVILEADRLGLDKTDVWHGEMVCRRVVCGSELGNVNRAS